MKDICDKVLRDNQGVIKLVYLFSVKPDDFNLIFMNNDDVVKGCGQNSFGTLGLGHSTRQEECIEIEDLTGRNLCDFNHGLNFVVGWSKNFVYTWGSNESGQCGRKYKSPPNVYEVPFNIEFPIDLNLNIESVCCGDNHTLVLISEPDDNGKLFGWGRKDEGQLGIIGEGYIDNYINTPQLIFFNEKWPFCRFKHIYCQGDNSFALHINGLLYYFGSKCAGFYRILDLFNVSKISMNNRKCYFLTNEQSVHYYNSQDESFNLDLEPRQIIEQGKIINFEEVCKTWESQIYCQGYDIILNYRYFKFDDDNLISFANMDNQTFQELIYTNHGIIPKASQYFLGKEYSISDQFISLIGSGGFGKVLKYWNFAEKFFYAKKELIDLQYDWLLEDEVVIMRSLNSDLVVKHYSSEQGHINMEYCHCDLRSILSIKQMVFKNNNQDINPKLISMNSTEYFISCEIFRQITEALNYLHTLEPFPVKHGDLKCENILIGMKGNKRICKLADFGQAKIIEDHPEKLKDDIMKLGLIAFEIFNLKDRGQDAELDLKLETLERIINENLLIRQKHRRISCEELLERFSEIEMIKRNEIETSELSIYKGKFIKMNVLYFCDIIDPSNEIQPMF